MSIAEQMGVALQNTAYSGEHQGAVISPARCFPPTARWWLNAPHIPVHLGSMDNTVKTVIRENPVIRPGDVYCVNAPYNGGTHLPDITICTPVFDERKKSILFWTASRGHHADVGGVSPGSMSPNAMTIEEEGVYMDNFKLVDRGRFREKELYGVLLGAKYPARNPVQNVRHQRRRRRNEKGCGLARW